MRGKASFKANIELEGLKREFDCAVKVILLGGPDVGKTAFFNRLLYNSFSLLKQPSVGIEVGSKLFDSSELSVCVDFWDAAGFERTYMKNEVYHESALAAFLLYDVTSQASLAEAAQVLAYFRERNASLMVCALGTKADLQHLREVTPEQGREFAERHQLSWAEVSAVSCAGVEKAFVRLMLALMKVIERLDLH